MFANMVKQVITVIGPYCGTRSKFRLAYTGKTLHNSRLLKQLHRSIINELLWEARPEVLKQTTFRGYVSGAKKYKVIAGNMEGKVNITLTDQFSGFTSEMYGGIVVYKNETVGKIECVNNAKTVKLNEGSRLFANEHNYNFIVYYGGKTANYEPHRWFRIPVGYTDRHVIVYNVEIKNGVLQNGYGDCVSWNSLISNRDAIKSQLKPMRKIWGVYYDGGSIFDEDYKQEVARYCNIDDLVSMYKGVINNSVSENIYRRWCHKKIK